MKAAEKFPKNYLKVRVDFLPDGRILPLMFKDETGRRVLIDRVLDVRPAPALKAGGQGIRYTCRIENGCVYLFCDRNRWFLEHME